MKCLGISSDVKKILRWNSKKCEMNFENFWDEVKGTTGKYFEIITGRFWDKIWENWIDLGTFQVWKNLEQLKNLETGEILRCLGSSLDI